MLLGHPQYQVREQEAEILIWSFLEQMKKNLRAALTARNGPRSLPLQETYQGEHAPVSSACLAPPHPLQGDSAPMCSFWGDVGELYSKGGVVRSPAGLSVASASCFGVHRARGPVGGPIFLQQNHSHRMVRVGGREPGTAQRRETQQVDRAPSTRCALRGLILWPRGLSQTPCSLSTLCASSQMPPNPLLTQRPPWASSQIPPRTGLGKPARMPHLRTLDTSARHVFPIRPVLSRRETGNRL